FPRRQFQQGEQVINVAVNPSIRQEAVQVKLAPVFLHVTDGSEEGVVFKEASLPDRLRHPGQILVDDSTCADVQVTHFGIAHLTLRQSHGLAAGLKKGMGIFRPVAVEMGLLRLGDGIAVGFLPHGKAVQDDQGYRLFPVTHRFFPPAAINCRKDSGSRLAPPTSAPSISASAKKASMLSGFTLPPYSIRTSLATC